MYLTFDDGPIPEVTPKVLAILEKYGVKATFFMVGENVAKHSLVFAQVQAAGHTIGNHTFNHLKGWSVPTDEYLENVELCQQVIDHMRTTEWAPQEERIMDAKHVMLFRPPYGKATLHQRRLLHNKGYRLIYWDILTRDYDASVTPEAMLRKIQRETRPGSIINFHDSLKSNERMLEVLPKAIEWLQAQGYSLRALNPLNW